MLRFTKLAEWTSVAILILSGCNQRPSFEGASELDGQWTVVAMHGDGVAAAPAQVDGMRWQVDGSEIVGIGPDGASGRMAFKLNPTTTPPEIDLTAVNGNRKGETDLGIYSLSENRLRICLAEVGHDRPVEFGSGPESWIMELERIRR